MAGVQLENGISGDVFVTVPTNQGDVGNFSTTTGGQVFNFDAQGDNGHSDATYTYNAGATAYYSPVENPMDATYKIEFQGPINMPDGKKKWTFKRWKKDGAGWPTNPDLEGYIITN